MCILEAKYEEKFEKLEEKRRNRLNIDGPVSHSELKTKKVGIMRRSNLIMNVVHLTNAQEVEKEVSHNQMAKKLNFLWKEFNVGETRTGGQQQKKKMTNAGQEH
jgi:hypothetical protein